jgi:hypothetical protein
MRLYTRLAHEERGAIFAIFAVMVLGLLLVAAFVIDVANIQEHKRHVQLQVDDAALAAGHEFTGCFQDPAATNKKVAGTAHQYGGDSDFANYWTNLWSAGPLSPPPAVPDGPYNQQVDEPDRVSLRMNSSSYAPAGTDFDTDMRSDLTGVQSQPCDALILDVKASDTGIPSFFGGVLPSGLNPFDTHARARVEIKQVEALSGFLPWAIPNVDPKHVAVVFTNETNGEILTAYELTNPPGGVVVRNGSPVDIWQGTPTVDIKRQTSMIVVTSRLGSEPTDPPFSVAGSLATICGQAKTACYADDDPTTATSGLLFIRANQNATGGAWDTPVLGEVTLTAGNCSDSSAPFYLVEADCNVGVRATVDFGPECGANPSANPCRASVTATGPACGGSTDLNFAGGVWSVAACGNPKIAQNSGPSAIRIAWSSQNPVNPVPAGQPRNASGTFGDNPASRVYAKDIDAGPIEYVRATPNPAPGGGPQPVSVEVGVPPTLQVSGKLDPSILLRFKETNGPNTQQVDCDHANIGPADEIRDGCRTTYDDDEDGICPPEYDEGNELPPDDFVVNPIPTCAAIRPGSVQSMVDGLHDRWRNSAFPLYSAKNCPHNNWPDAATEPVPGPEDPRWVILIVTDISAFKAPPGQDPVVPIVKWAGFYVTGVDNSNKTPPCPDDPATPKNDGDDPHPLGYPSNKDNGDVWGHFVNFVPFIGGATPGDPFCNFAEIGICVAVLTR